jgi:hypothetical protein
MKDTCNVIDKGVRSSDDLELLIPLKISCGDTSCSKEMKQPIGSDDRPLCSKEDFAAT